MKTALAAATLCLALLPRPASAEATMQDIGATVAKIVGRVSSDWTWETTAPIVLPLTRKPSNFEDSLAKGRALGAMLKCTGRLDPFEQIPNVVKYSGQCKFVHGQARVYIGFGIGKDKEPVLIALGVFPNAGTEADYAKVAPDPTAGPLNVGGTVDWRTGPADAASPPAGAAVAPTAEAIEPPASPAEAIAPPASPEKATEATASPEEPAKPEAKP